MNPKNILKIGIYINQNSLSGGGFYESLSTIKRFNTDKFDTLYFTSNKNCKRELIKEGLKVNYISINILDRFIKHRLAVISYSLFKKRNICIFWNPLTLYM